jgi:GT2 family glycosyltransferase
VIVVDGLPPGVKAVPGARVLGLEDLALGPFPELRATYDIAELCTAVKPSLLALLFDRFDEEAVVYLDPEVLILRPLDELQAALAEAVIVLTPHLLRPLLSDGRQPTDHGMLLVGAYNQGMLGVRRGPETDGFLRWWLDHLLDSEGAIAGDAMPQLLPGIVTAQRWLDLVPGLFAETAILRDETYNVGWWNLPHRNLSRNGDRFCVNGRPLASFQFSGFTPTEPARLTRDNQDRVVAAPGSGLADLLALYAELALQAGYTETSSWSPDFTPADYGPAARLLLRRLYLSLDEERRAPFRAAPLLQRAQVFLDWATRPRATDGCLSPLLLLIYRSRSDLAAAFPDACGRDRDAFLQWAEEMGSRQYGYNATLVSDCRKMSMCTRTEASSDPDSSQRTGASTMPFSGTLLQPGPGLRDRPAPRCTIIIPVHGKASLTRRCLDVLFSQPPERFEREIVVVDDASPDATPQMLVSYGDRIRVLTHVANAGFSISCNDGAATARGEYLVFLNNDTVPQPGWLEALVQYADSHPRAAVVGCKLLFPDDTVQHAGVVICQDSWPTHIYAGFPADHPAVNKSRRFQVVTAGCALVRRGPFQELGGFDTSFRNGFEDVDLCLRLGELGYEVHYCHESVLYHLESVSDGRHTHNNHNDELYRRRWKGRARPDDLDYYVEDGLLRLNYWEMFPAQIEVSPLLALVRGEASRRQSDRLLTDRASQVYELLRDNIRLSVRVQEAELRATGDGDGAPQRTMSRERIRWLEPGPANSREAISEIRQNGNIGGLAVPEKTRSTALPRGGMERVASAEPSSLSTRVPPNAEPDRRAPRCTVIIPVHGKASLTRRCLDVLFTQQPQGFEREIVVVDDASPDATPQLLARYGNRIRVVTHAANAGFSTACNHGAATARGEYLVFLNNDTVPQPGWLETLVRYADVHPQAAVVGCKLLFPDDTVQHAGVVVCQDRELCHIYAGFPADHPAVNKSRRFQVVTAGCALVRRGPFHEVGGFDTGFRNSYDDVDLCLRLGERGYEVHYCHESVVYHLESVSDGRFLHTDQNSRLYGSRWRHRVRPDDLKYYVEDELLQIYYNRVTPLEIDVSPLLATPNREESRRQVDRLLRDRARQVYELLRDNVRLSVRVQEAELRAAVAASPDGSG